MKIQRLLFAILSLSPAVALAHPGHEASELHLHAGAPTIFNSVDLRLVAAGLVLGLVYHGIRSFQRR
jgi:hypothetical protein